MSPLAELSVWKLLGLALVAIAVLAFLLLFAWLLWRELRIEMKVRRSARTQQLPHPIAREYTGKDGPSWHRCEPGRRARVRLCVMEFVGE
jgi:hypothetical protein